jgi:hypothetical protein
MAPPNTAEKKPVAKKTVAKKTVEGGAVGAKKGKRKAKKVETYKIYI